MKVYLTLFSLFFSTLTLAHGVDANTQQFLATYKRISRERNKKKITPSKNNR
jgi:hypothetical protein